MRNNPPKNHDDGQDEQDPRESEQLRAWLAGAEERRRTQGYPHPDSRADLKQRLRDLQSTHPHHHSRQAPMADDLTELDHYTQLRAWAAGVYPVEAAVELLIRTGRARTTDAWIKPFDPDQGGSQAGHWVDFDTIPDHLNGLSNGEQRVLRIAAALGGDTATVNLNDALTTLDRHTADLVLAAISHAAGTHQGVLTSTDQDGRLTATDVPGPLYPWPDTR